MLSRSAVVFASALVVWAAIAAPRCVAAPAPAADLAESFGTDPRANASWSLSGTWTWDPAAKTLVSARGVVSEGRWLPGRHYAGTLSARVKLNAGPPRKPPSASLLFAVDPETGASRWVRITAGAPGSVVLGQTGDIAGTAARTIKTVRVSVPARQWLNLSVAVGAGGTVTVKLGTRKLFAVAAGPLSPGTVGVVAASSAVAFDSVAFVGAPDLEPCAECHAGQEAGAPARDVFRYWDGSWWSGNRGGTPGAQHGGHGDPGGRAATGCTGAAGCHDLRQPAPGDHRNGVYEPGGAATANPFHLRAGYVAAAAPNPWTVATTFDTYCYTACHKAAGVKFMRHGPVDGTRPYLQLGQKGTNPDGALVPEGAPLDHDLSALASPGRPVFAPCVTCHDPHGSPEPDTTLDSNRMVRLGYRTSNELCLSCHQ
jgi:predicted CXXCH cytochrome family protein